MKKLLFSIFCLIAVCISVIGCNTEKIDAPTAKAEEIKISKAINTKADYTTTKIRDFKVEEQQKTQIYPEFSYSKDWSKDEEYLLAKIAMAEAEGENIQTKSLVILTVLNRVYSDEFPDTIHDVIFQYNKETDTYQFSPVMPDGRWWTTEPNEDCWEAVEVAMNAQYDYSEGALYFESCKYDSWHSRNLDFLYQSGKLRFYE